MDEHGTILGGCVRNIVAYFLTHDVVLKHDVVDGFLRFHTGEAHVETLETIRQLFVVNP